MMVSHGLKFQYRTHIGPIWALCPDSANMGLIWPCLLGCIMSLLKYYTSIASSVKGATKFLIFWHYAQNYYLGC